LNGEISNEIKNIEDIYFKWDEKMTQAQKGFNKYIQKKMIQSGLHHEYEDFKIECSVANSTNKTLYAYQRTVEFAVRPQTPIYRFLVLHATGSGKTISIIKILSNYYTKTNDERTKFPKIVILKDERDNARFLEEFLDGIDNPYSHAFKKQYESPGQGNLYHTGFSRDMINNTLSGIGSDVMTRKQKIEVMCSRKQQKPKCRKEYESMKNSEIDARFKLFISSQRYSQFRRFLQTDSERTAPLRIRSYISMGYKREQDDNTFYGEQGSLENKFIILDEYHSFLTKDINKDITNRKDSYEKAQKIRKQLKVVKNSVIIGCTATPLVGNTVTELLDEIRGSRYPVTSPRCDEGFVSYMLEYPKNIYPGVIPGVPTRRFPNLRRVVLFGDNRKKYIDNINTSTTQTIDNGYYAHWRHSKNQLKKSYFNKFYVIRDTILKENEHKKKKTLILIDTGAETLYNILKMKGIKVGYIKCDDMEDKYIKDEFQNVNNKYGDIIQVLIANVKKYGTGHNFIARKLILVNPPKTASLYLQYLGRVLRSCIYKNEFNNEREEIVELCIYCSCFQETKHNTYPELETQNELETHDEKILQHLISKELPSFLSQMQKLKNISIDNDILQVFYKDNFTTPRDDLEFYN
jgi:superfamily II DNA or RNA helicase